MMIALRVVWLVSGLLLLALPLVKFMHIPEPTRKLFGVERKVVVPAFNMRNFMSGDFQKLFSEDFAKTFFPRRAFLITRNQICEWLNFGLFHEGYGQNVLEGDGGCLFERHYLMFHLQRHELGENLRYGSLGVLEGVVQKCQARGIDVNIILAPDKVQLCADEIPLWAPVFGPLTAMDIQADFKDALAQRGIRAFDAAAYLKHRQADYAERMFPLAGTHWNALAAGLVVDRVFDELNAGGGVNRYRVRRFQGVRAVDRPAYNDDDIGRLLNLWWSPSVSRTVSYRPVFAVGDGVNECGALIFGDSFSEQVMRIMRDGGYFRSQDIVLCDKRVPTAEEWRRLSGKLKCVTIVFTTPNFWAVLTSKRWDWHLRQIRDGV